MDHRHLSSVRPKRVEIILILGTGNLTNRFVGDGQERKTKKQKDDLVRIAGLCTGGFRASLFSCTL